MTSETHAYHGAPPLCQANHGRENGFRNIVDHVSAAWNQDDGIGTNIDVRDVTFSWNITAEPVGSTEQAHPTGMSSLAGSPASANTMTNVDFHHNLTMNNSHRNPLLRNRSSRIVNNLGTTIGGTSTLSVAG
jgi:hypothetical protein